jgi:hypothetical protein
VAAHIITAETPALKRKLILDWFGSVSSDIRLIFSVHVLNEGINVLQCDSVFMHHNSSIYCNDQRALRSMRVYGDKTAAVIIWSALEHTSGILDLTANARTLCAVTPVIGKTVLANEQQTVLRVQAQVDKDIEFGNVKSVLWMYKERVQFYTDTMARDGKLETGTQIYDWMNNQKSAYRNGTLSLDRQKMCEDAGILLKRIKGDRLSSDEKVQIIVYAMKNGINMKRNKSMQYQGITTPIGRIVNTIRIAHKKQRLTNEQVHTLTEAGFVLHFPESIWTSFYAAWSSAKKSGNIKQRQICVDTGLKIGRWQDAQRRFHKKGTLTQSRFSRMAEVDPEWYNGRF